MNEIEDEKLLIFGWITTVFGLPPKANPDKYNELTDKLHKLFSDLIKQSQQDLIDKIEKSLPKGTLHCEDLSVAWCTDCIKQCHDEVTTILKQAKEGL